MDKMATATTSKWRVFAICVLCLAINVDRVISSQEVMKKLTSGFSKVLDQCKTELNVGDHILQDFFNFWREEYELLNRDMGCIVLCMATKLDLISEDMKLHHGNAHEFAKNHGADDELAKQLVTIIHGCETVSIGIEDSCNRALEVAKCFRSKMHELKWAPSMEVVLEEVMLA